VLSFWCSSPASQEDQVGWALLAIRADLGEKICCHSDK
jgi:hypothetical protein